MRVAQGGLRRSGWPGSQLPARPHRTFASSVRNRWQHQHEGPVCSRICLAQRIPPRRALPARTTAHRCCGWPAHIVVCRDAVHLISGRCCIAWRLALLPSPQRGTGHHTEQRTRLVVHAVATSHDMTDSRGVGGGCRSLDYQPHSAGAPGPPSQIKRQGRTSRPPLLKPFREAAP